MDYNVREIVRGIASGKVDETEGRKLISDYLDLDIKAAKLLKPLYEEMRGLQTGGNSVPSGV